MTHQDEWQPMAALVFGLENLHQINLVRKDVGIKCE